jgi:hypothetical protein
MSNKLGTHAFLLAILVAPFFCAQADNAETANKSISPLNLAPWMSVQDYYTPKYYDSRIHSNDLLLRATAPTSPRPIPTRTAATAPVKFTLYAGLNAAFGT